MVFAAIAWAAVSAAGVQAQTVSQRVVVDRHSGIAIGGIDPVAYFTEGDARLGDDAHEAVAAGATWRFRNDGNRAAFAADPEVYAPQFGGYDPVALATGVAAAGRPQIWLILGRRLYLFDSTETRNAFAADAAKLTLDAQRRWPSVQAGLGE